MVNSHDGGGSVDSIQDGGGMKVVVWVIFMMEEGWRAWCGKLQQHLRRFILGSRNIIT